MRNRTILLLAMALTLPACAGVKKQLGLSHNAPDEFAVVKRAPLSMPPDYTLRPPRPGAPRPQEEATVDQAQETVFGPNSTQDNAAPATGNDALLQQAGADNADPNIRQRVDRETAALPPANQTTVKKLLNLGSTVPPAANVVDAPAETQRLKTDAATGKPVTAGETPSKEE